MVNYYVKRVGQAVFTLLSVMTLAFTMFRYLPGGPMDYLRAQLMQSQTTSGDSGGAGQSSGGSTDLDVESFNQLAEAYTGVNPDKPIHLAYVEYLAGVLTGDLGRSLWFDQPVAAIIAEALPWTLFILVAASLITFLTGIILGAIMAYAEGSRFDSGMTIINLIQHSIPFFVFAIILLVIFSHSWEVLPEGGRINPDTTPGFNYPYIAGVISHAILPTVTLIIAGFGGGALTMRGNSIRVLGEDYLRVARLRGLPSHRIALRYVMRNSVLPMYTGFMISLGTLFGGSVILERIFSYPGLGYYTVEAFTSRDYPLLMGTFMLTTIVVIIGVLIADLTYGLLDPRVETGDSEVY